MKRVINGKRYDTDTAKIMGSDSYSYPGDFNHWSETLYRKQTGEFFLYGAGGPASKYAEAIGMNQWSGGSRIFPLSLEAAQKWAEDHLDGDAYEKIFGEIEESTKKRTVTFSLTEAAIAKIARLTQEWGCTKSDVIEKLLSR